MDHKTPVRGYRATLQYLHLPDGFITALDVQLSKNFTK
jgi:hypothetical protein